MIHDDEKNRKERRATAGAFAKNLSSPIPIKPLAPQKDIDSLASRVSKIEAALRANGIALEDGLLP